MKLTCSILTFLLIAVLGVNSAAAKRTTAKNSDLQAVEALASRVLGDRAGQVEFEIIADTLDRYSVSPTKTKGKKVKITGNNANSLATGLNDYLRNNCLVTVGWFKDDKPELPAILPAVTEKREASARVKDRFFLNYCTFGYSMPWWTWEDWEHFIDWMALNGINLPLAITGQESIWYRVWTELGIPEKEVREYFTGPAHLPWHRMLNIDRWQGPLPQSWLDSQAKLQRQITDRERELNMRPVLPAFAGHVPAALKDVYPEANISQLSAWAGYPKEYACSFLDPMDPLFGKIQQKYLETQHSLYGSDHIYGIDLFNELTPPSWEPEYLRRVSRQVYESLSAVDPKAVWLQMTWLFWNDRKDWTNDRVEPYITSIPKEKSLLLDYYCDRQEVWQRTDKYYGVPYIWCYLGNFGGNTNLAGNLKLINERFENARLNGGNLKGIGCTLEALDCNPYLYEYVLEKAWGHELPSDLPAWSASLSDRRTSSKDSLAREGWQMIVDSIYTSYSSPGQCSMVNVRPSFGNKITVWGNNRITYDNRYLAEALGKIIASEGKGNAYEFDLVNLTRQMLGNYSLDVFKAYEKAYNEGDRETMAVREAEMMELLADMDTLLGTRSEFLLGKWIADARSWGVDEAEKDYFESNARNLLTTWGERDKYLNDYANRTWNGLVSSYYAPRWRMFFNAVNKAVANGNGKAPGTEFDEEALKAYRNDVTAFEEDWWVSRPGTFSAVPSGDGIALAKALYAKYLPKVNAK